MIKNKGVTLLELLIAVSLGTLIVLAAGGIYISGWNMFRDAQNISQAQRNAVIPMMHMVKNIHRSTPWNGNLNNYWNGRSYSSYSNIEFKIDDARTPTNFADDDTLFYSLSGTDLDCNTTAIPGSVTTSAIIGTRISNCNFTYGGTNPTVTITMNATDNKGTNQYTLTSSAESRYMPAQ